MNEISTKIKELRSRKGYSQEELAERSGLSLRTIQRIENGETEPRGDSLVRLAAAFDVTVDDLADWGLVVDNKFIAAMNLSALSFLFFPLMGILVPMIIWLSKKGKIKGLDDVAARLLNYQITWTIILSASYVCSILIVLVRVGKMAYLFMFLTFWGVMYAVNIVTILLNSVRAGNGKKVSYSFAIRFIK